MVTARPRQRPYTPSRLLDGPVIVDIEHRLVALDAALPTAAGSSAAGADHAAARPALEELWPADAPAERVGPGGRVWHAASLGEWEAAGRALGDGPAGPEAIPGRPVSRRRRRTGADSLAWSGEALSALSDSRPSVAYSRPRAAPRPSVLSWRWTFYFLLCRPFLALTRVLRPRGGTAIPRTLLVLAAVTGVLVTVALLAELPQRSRPTAPAQVQPTAEVAEAQPPGEAIPTQGVSAVPIGTWVMVANTDGQGLYLRRQPDLSSKWVAWSEGTNLQVLAAGVSGTGAPSASGAAWLQVRDPEGRVGYVPEQYVAPAPSP